ncbi:MAG: hypothetical protein GKS06_09740 [Acidobacteria bacterium]|nr:hypothetical protein [Acidobacteriota bacterium]
MPAPATRLFTFLIRGAAVAALLFAPLHHVAGQQAAELVGPGHERLSLPDFEAYEVEYTSASGRFLNQVRPFQLDGVAKISILNLIDMPSGVIVDHAVVDRATLRQEYGATPYFAWGMENILLRATANELEIVRVPMGGGAPVVIEQEFDHGGYFEPLGFSPTYAALLPADEGTVFQIARRQPVAGGSIRTDFADFVVLGMETLETPAGLRCDCTILEERVEGGATHRYWVARQAPFLFKRHRDIGGARDFVSEALSFRHVR